MLVIGDGIRTGAEANTAYAIPDAWPPPTALLRERVIHAARSRGGRWVTVSTTPDQPQPNRVRVADTPTGARTALLPDDERKFGVEWADFVGERVVAMLWPQGIPPLYASHLSAVPLIEDAGKLVPIEGLPAAQGDERSYGMAHLHDGTDVFLWAGEGYELREGHLEATFELDVQPKGEPTVPWGPDGFLYLHYELVTPSKYIQTCGRRGEVRRPCAICRNTITSCASRPGPRARSW